MLRAGRIQKLTVSRISDYGLYLADEEQNEVLLPNRYISLTDKPGDEKEVFLYHDSEDRLVATTETPLLRVGEAGYLRVVDKTAHGAFLNWGLYGKDLFLPNRNQQGGIIAGRSYIVYLYEDSVTGRCVATCKLKSFINNDIITVAPRQEVDLLVASESPIGYRVIINNRHWGMLYREPAVPPHSGRRPDERLRPQTHRRQPHRRQPPAGGFRAGEGLGGGFAAAGPRQRRLPAAERRQRPGRGEPADADEQEGFQTFAGHAAQTRRRHGGRTGNKDQRVMAKITTAERVSREASDNFVFQRSLLAYHAAAQRISGDVLEIGTGAGYGIEVVAPRARSFVTIDKLAPAPEPTQLPNVEFRQATVPPLPFANDSFDFVISFQVIEHIKRDLELVREVKRVLRPGGKFIVTTPNAPMSLTRNPWHIREYTAAELRSLLGSEFFVGRGARRFGQRAGHGILRTEPPQREAHHALRHPRPAAPAPPLSRCNSPTTFSTA